MEPDEDGLQTIIAEVPLAELANFTTFIRQTTQGRGWFTTEFARYEILPEMLVPAVVEQARKLGNLDLGESADEAISASTCQGLPMGGWHFQALSALPSVGGAFLRPFWPAGRQFLLTRPWLAIIMNKLKMAFVCGFMFYDTLPYPKK